MFKDRIKKKRRGPKSNVMKVRTSRKIYIPIYLMIFVLVSAVVFIKYRGFLINKYVLILVVVFIVLAIKYTEIHRFSRWYEVNSNSLVHKEGILSKKIKNLDLCAISDIDVSQNLWQRLLGYGDISVRLFSEVSHTEIKNINDPAKFGNFLEKMMGAKMSN